MRVRLKQNVNPADFFPMHMGVWYEGELSHSAENVFTWMYIPKLEIHIDTRHLEFKKEE